MTSEVLGVEADNAAEYFEEVLLTYRLIFGQTKASYKAFNSSLPRWSEEWCKTPSLESIADPLLSIICGQSWESAESSALFDEIEAEDASNHYSPHTDFPYLGKKLKHVQEYVKGHNPYTLRSLWHDDRDLGKWWTFWVSALPSSLVIETKTARPRSFSWYSRYSSHS